MTAYRVIVERKRIKRSHELAIALKEAFPALAAVIRAQHEALEECLPYAAACVGLPRQSWPHDSAILKAERAIAKTKILIGETE